MIKGIRVFYAVAGTSNAGSLHLHLITSTSEKSLQLDVTLACCMSFRTPPAHLQDNIMPQMDGPSRLIHPPV